VTYALLSYALVLGALVFYGIRLATARSDLRKSLSTAGKTERR
jgi:hypothetical protein